MTTSRREFFRGVAGAAGTALLGTKAAWSRPQQSLLSSVSSSPPAPARSGIEHIIVVMMENRSFDHFLGWMPGADGKQAGLSFTDLKDVARSTYPLAPDFRGCPKPVDNSYQGGRVQWDHSAMDGWLRLTTSSLFAIGYYVEADQPFLSALARNFTTLDHHFCSILAPTFPNRLFLYTAQTDRLADSISLTALPTILDSLGAAGVSARYYFSNLPFLALWGLKYLPITRTYSQFLSDASSGHLPAVSFVDPAFTILDDGTGNDDHPHTGIRRGDAFLARTFHAVASSPAWRKTVFIVVFDEWGGFFDHVPPPRAAAPNNVDPDLVSGQALLGFRIPAIVASPWTRGNPASPSVNSTVFDHTSVLKLIEWRWSLGALTARDASDDIGNLVTALNFSSPVFEAPSLPQPAAPSPVPCLPTLFQAPLAQPGAQPAAENEWSKLASSNLLEGWRGKIQEATHVGQRP